ncbi:MAG: helix-turn-helix domain-containing protein, partial [Motilibacteraceae bacterium]
MGDVVSLTVRHLMVDHDLTQTALAVVLGITQPQVSARLRGAAPWSLHDLEVLASYFGVTVADLVGGQPKGDGPHDGGERARRDSNPQP